MARPVTFDYSKAPHKDLSDRLLAAAEQNPRVPNFNDGLLVYMSKQFKQRYDHEVSTEVVRRWFRGLSKPRAKTVERLAEILSVDHYWLVTGTEHAVSEKARKINSERQDGATQLISGLLRLHDYNCFTPDTDGEYNPNTDLVVIHESAVKQLVLRAPIKDSDASGSTFILRFPPIAPKQIVAVAIPTGENGLGFTIFRISETHLANSSKADGIGYLSQAKLIGGNLVLDGKNEVVPVSNMDELFD